jgi:hypothetical protein
MDSVFCVGVQRLFYLPGLQLLVFWWFVVRPGGLSGVLLFFLLA